MLSSKTKRELKIDQRQILIDSIEIGVPSPQQILSWGERILPNGKKVGLIKNSKTVNYKRFTPFRDGLFCERIFGPVTSFVCACGKKQPHNKVAFCEKCEVEYIDQRARRYRLGYISLLSPVTHIWYLKGRPSYLSLFLGKRKKTIVALAYCNAYLIEHGISKRNNIIETSDVCRKKKLFELKEQETPIQEKLNFLSQRLKKTENPKTESCISLCKIKREPAPLLALQKTNPGFAFKLRPLDFLQNRFLYEGSHREFVRRQNKGTRKFGILLYLTKRRKQKNARYSSCILNRYTLFAERFCKKARKQRSIHKLACKKVQNNCRCKPSYKTKLCTCTCRQIEDLSAKQKNVKVVRSGTTPICLAKARGFFDPKRLQYMQIFDLQSKARVKLQLQKLSKRAMFCKNNVHLLTKQSPYGRTSTYKCKYKAFNKDLHKLFLDKREQNYFRVAKTKFLPSKNEAPEKDRPESQASSYGFYSYARQHTLPFLPSLISHFYLRDALLSFIYSSASYEDFPLMEYCHTKRWEPLRDVHKFMAHKTVDNLKTNSSYDFPRSLKNFSRKKQNLKGLRGYKRKIAPFNKVHKKSCNPYEQQLVRRKVKGKQYKKKMCKHLKSFLLADKSLFKNERKTVFSEENKKVLLSGLEVTAIREILSYTGGGALQQLLQQFNQHNLCKFLFAEAQILRVLYETQIAALLELQQKKALSKKLSCNPFLQSQSFARLRFLEPSLRVEGFSREKKVVDLKTKQEDLFSTGEQHADNLLFCNNVIPNKALFLKSFDSQLGIDSKKAEILPTSKLKKICIKKGLYDDFQNKTPDLQKKQILRISRRIYKVARRLKITQLLTRNHRKPEWMILSHLPVLPPDLRPILQMSEKVIVASDLNIMYQRVIYRNNRHLRVRFIDFHLVTAIQRLVQDAVDRLIENGKGGSKPYYTQGGRPLKSLSDILKGKKGRFRLNLLGKRVDFSGRSVIVVSPLCQIHECGIPKDIAFELYHYFLLRQLIVKKQCASIVTAKKMIKSRSSLIWDLLRELMYHHPVLLNRAPTLHRLGIQAFQPKLVLGNAILLHPLVCSGFNADFDGDQMGVHLPLSFAARAESWDLLWSRNNLLSPATGQPMLVPSQDMVLGFYYITAQAVQPEKNSWFQSDKPKEKDLHPYKDKYKYKALNKNPRGKKIRTTGRFLNIKDITTTLQTGKIKVHQPVWLYWSGKIENEELFQKPLELRIHTLGVQQSIYENYISSTFFTKSCVTTENEFCSCLKLVNRCSLNKKIKDCSFSTYKSSLSKYAKSEIGNQNKTLFSNFNESNIDNNPFFISSHTGAQYIRTTAGRVLMNNLIKD